MFRNEIEEHLRDKLLPFWENLEDRTHGGFFGLVDRDLRIWPEADKGCILHARILWTFSTAARILKDASLLEYGYE